MINLKYKRFILPKSFGIVVHNQWVLTALDLNMCVLSYHPSQCVQWRGASPVLSPSTVNEFFRVHTGYDLVL